MKKLPALVSYFCIGTAIASFASYAQEGSYGPIKPGDTLWKIAETVYSHDNAHTVADILAIQAANPQVFELTCNLNAPLKPGSTLHLPAVADRETLSLPEAEQRYGQQLADWKQHIETGQPVHCASGDVREYKGNVSAIERASPPSNADPAPLPTMPTSDIAKVPDAKLPQFGSAAQNPTPESGLHAGQVAAMPKQLPTAVPSKTPIQYAQTRSWEQWIATALITVIVILLATRIAYRIVFRASRGSPEMAYKSRLPAVVRSATENQEATANGSFETDFNARLVPAMTDIMLHIKEEIDRPQAQWLLSKLLREPGILKVIFEPRDQHILTVTYDRRYFSRLTLFDTFTQYRLHVDLASM